NPVLNNKAFVSAGPGADPMTLNGTVNKTAMLLAMTLITAVITWGMAWESMQATDGSVPMNPMLFPLMIGGAVAGFILALVCVFKKTAAPVLAPLYALAEGLFIGGVSATFEMKYPGIVLQAVGLTFGT